MHAVLFRSFLLCAAGIGVALNAVPAVATDFPVTGTLSVNGNSGALPTGGVFANSSYDPATGEIGAGAFVFPNGTISFPSNLGTVVVSYQLTQTNTSTGTVDADGLAVLSQAALSLTVTHVTVSGIPVPVGTCVFTPIDIDLSGTASATGLSLAANGFSIPPVAPSDCGGNGTQINNAVAGSNNAMQGQIAGDFTPPGDDTIFIDGFDGASG